MILAVLLAASVALGCRLLLVQRRRQAIRWAVAEFESHSAEHPIAYPAQLAIQRIRGHAASRGVELTYAEAVRYAADPLARLERQRRHALAHGK